MPLRPKPKRAVRSKSVEKRFRGTFLHVEDDDMPHNNTNEVAHDLRLKKVFAYDPIEAKYKLEKRVNAIRKLWRIKRLQRDRTRDPKRKVFLQGQMDYLDGMQKAPFDMIISDVNMPARNPTGLGLVRYIKKGYPNQKVLVYSDDYANIRHLEKEHGVLSVNKVSEKNNVDELKEHLVRELKLAPIKKPKGKAKFTPTRIRGP